VFGQSYHWSLMQVEYATDLAFRSAATLGPLYEQLVRQSVLNVHLPADRREPPHRRAGASARDRDPRTTG
jgi:hypothetical protein